MMQRRKPLRDPNRAKGDRAKMGNVSLCHVTGYWNWDRKTCIDNVVQTLEYRGILRMQLLG